MKPQTKVALVTLVLAILAFLTEPHGPLGSFWAPDPSMPEATGAQVPLFMLLGVFEAVGFGLGVAFLLLGFSPLKAILPDAPGLARAAHLSIAWLLLNWWAHDSLHVHNGMNLNGLLGIEYAFHVTLIISGAILAWFFVALARAPATADARAA